MFRSKVHTTSPVDSVGIDVWSAILSHLSVRDLLDLRRVSRTFRKRAEYSLREVTKLAVEPTEIRMIETMAKLSPNILSLWIDGFKIPEAMECSGLLTAVGGFVRLQSLVISSAPAVGSLDGIQNLPNLRELSIDDLPTLSDISRIIHCPALLKISIVRCTALRTVPIPDEACKPPPAEQIILERVDVRDLSPLVGWVNLRRISICHVTKLRDVSPLARLRALTDVSLIECSVVSIAPIASLPKLSKLRLIDLPHVTDLQSLRNLLETLTRLEASNIGTQSIPLARPLGCVSILERLRSLTLTDVFVDVLELGDRLGPQLTHLEQLSMIRCTGDTRLDVSLFPSLLTIALIECDRIFLINTAAHPGPSCPYLTDLSIIRCGGNWVAGLGHILHSSLQNVRLMSRDIRDLRLFPLLCPALRILDLSGSSSLVDCVPIAALKDLEFLWLAGCVAVRDLSFLRVLSRIRCLSIAGLRFATSIASIGMLQNLEVLDISGCISINDLHPLRYLQNLRAIDATGIPASFQNIPLPVTDILLEEWNDVVTPASAFKAEPSVRSITSIEGSENASVSKDLIDLGTFDAVPDCSAKDPPPLSDKFEVLEDRPIAAIEGMERSGDDLTTNFASAIESSMVALTGISEAVLEPSEAVVIPAQTDLLLEFENFVVDTPSTLRHPSLIVLEHAIGCHDLERSLPMIDAIQNTPTAVEPNDDSRNVPESVVVVLEASGDPEDSVVLEPSSDFESGDKLVVLLDNGLLHLHSFDLPLEHSVLEDEACNASVVTIEESTSGASTPPPPYDKEGREVVGQLAILECSPGDEHLLEESVESSDAEDVTGELDSEYSEPSDEGESSSIEHSVGDGTADREHLADRYLEESEHSKSVPADDDECSGNEVAKTSRIPVEAPDSTDVCKEGSGTSIGDLENVLEMTEQSSETLPPVVEVLEPTTEHADQPSYRPPTQPILFWNHRCCSAFVI